MLGIYHVPTTTAVFNTAIVSDLNKKRENNEKKWKKKINNNDVTDRLIFEPNRIRGRWGG